MRSLSERELQEGLLRAVAGAPIAIIHSDISSLRMPPDAARRALLRAIRHITAGGTTLVFPTFTFTYCRSRSYHPGMPSETGILGEWVLDLVDAVRTPHPIYSFSAVGRLVEEIRSCANTTTWGDDSVFAEVERLGGRVVMLGCGWEYCTFFHRLEEIRSVPYRQPKAFPGRADFGDGERDVAPVMWVRDLELDARNEWKPLVERLRAAGVVREEDLGPTRILSAACADIRSVGEPLLAEDPWAVASQPRRLEQAHRHRERRTTSPPLRVALFGHANTSLIADALDQTLSALLPDRAIDLVPIPYGQTDQAIIDDASPLNQRPVDVSICVDRVEDLLGVYSLEEVDPAQAEARVRHWISLLQRHRQRHPTPLLVSRFADASGRTAGIADAAHREGTGPLIARLDALLADELAAEGCTMLPTSRWLATARVQPRDERLWFLGRFPYSQGFSAILARHYAGAILSLIGRTARVVVLDLDNTLWGGVLGEDGFDGIRVGGDYPGNAFRCFQSALLGLTKRGIVLAICSKNDRTHALDAIERHPGMILRRKHFVADRIGWTSKAEGVAAICAELGLRPEQALFVDDNPTERGLVASLLPDANVLELPPDPADWVQALLECPWLGCVSLTAEDADRTTAYQARAAIAAARTSAGGDMASFLRSLQVVATMQALDDGNLARAEQLMVKTNQFNTTTRRYTARHLRDRSAAGDLVLVIAAEDRFSPRENVGVLVVRLLPAEATAQVDAYLLSCRVLSKGLETGILSWLAASLKALGWRRIIGEVIETERNAPVRDVFARAGYESMGAGLWTLDLARMDALQADDVITVRGELHAEPLPFLRVAQG